MGAAVLGLAWAMLPGPLPGSAPSAPIPEVEVRAERIPELLSPFPLAGRRLGRDVVERRPGGDVRDLLAPVAGVRLASRGASWSGSDVSLRGSTHSQVLVLVDGRRRAFAQGGGADLTGLLLRSVESVDVYRGGASALWGSDAIGGAIHVRTRAPEPGALSVRAGSGSFGERSLDVGAALGASASWRGRVAGGIFRAGGAYAFPDSRRGVQEHVANGDVARAAAEARVDGALSAADLRLDASASSSERGLPGSVEFPTPAARLEEERNELGARVQGRGTWSPVLDVSLQRARHEYRDPDGPFGPVREEHRNRRWEGMAQVTRSAGGVALRLSGGGAADRLRSTTDGNRSRHAGNLGAQLSGDTHLAAAPLRWMAAARLDGSRGFSPFLTPRVGAVVRMPGDRLWLRASAGASYRAPSFDELFWPPRATAAGNPDLRSERGMDVDAGFALQGLPGAARVSLDGFARSVADLIQWIPGASGVWRPHNVGRVILRGLEAEVSLGAAARGKLSWRLTGSGTLLAAEDRTGEPNVHGRRLVYRPRWTGTAGLLLWRSGAGELETLWRLVDDVFVTRANTKTLPGHVLGELRWRGALGPSVVVDAAVTNWTDAEARDFRDVPLPGRSWKLGLTWERGRK